MMRSILLPGLAIVVIAACTRLAVQTNGHDWTPTGGPARAREIAPREPCTDHEPLRQAFFGDLHVHTGYSFDARSRDTRSTPDDAYRFARGEAIGLGPFDADGRGTRSARLALRRHPTTRDLRDEWTSNHAALLRRLGPARRPLRAERWGRGGISKRRAHGQRADALGVRRARTGLRCHGDARPGRPGPSGQSARSPPDPEGLVRRRG
ncbi:MAG: DUF3604 domain-containing protein [Deltaproteobacteria bacterium]|nr:DUF3604 domain-containing protein [Deltaproteobacteria bacterium]